MSTIYRFEDLPIWQQSRTLCDLVNKLVKKSPLFLSDFKLKDQIKGASGSVMDNIAEGFERSSRLEFANFLSIAKGSTGEVRSQIYRAIDYDYIDTVEGISIIDEYDKLAKKIAGFINYLNRSAVKGQKFKDRE